MDSIQISLQWEPLILHAFQGNSHVEFEALKIYSVTLWLANLPSESFRTEYSLHLIQSDIEAIETIDAKCASTEDLSVVADHLINMK